MVEQQRYWFAARTRDKQEYTVRTALQKLGIAFFLPTRLVVRQLKYRRKEVEVPVIRNLVFVYTTKQQALDLANKECIPLFYLKDLFTRTLLVIPTKQMEDFVQVMALDPQRVSIEENPLAVGARVKVIKGELCGVEGELLSTGNRTYVLIRIEGVLTAKVKVLRADLRVAE